MPTDYSPPSHFEFTGETLEHKGHLLHRIRSVGRTTVLGGWIESADNLHGQAWVGDEAKVYGNARVDGCAKIINQAEVYGNATVTDTATVGGSAHVNGNAQVGMCAWIARNAHIEGNTQIFGHPMVWAGRFTGGIVNISSTHLLLDWPVTYPPTSEVFQIDHCFHLTFGAGIEVRGIRTKTGGHLYVADWEGPLTTMPTAIKERIAPALPFIHHRIARWHTDTYPTSTYYEFTGATRIHKNRVLRQIRATRPIGQHASPGDIGGWIESRRNLTDHAWVSDDAMVFGNAQIRGYSLICDNAQVSGDAIIINKIVDENMAITSGIITPCFKAPPRKDLTPNDTTRHFRLTEETCEHNGHILHLIQATKDTPGLKAGTLGGWVEHERNIAGNGWVNANGMVYGNAVCTGYVYGSAKVFDTAQVHGEVEGDCQIGGTSVVPQHAWLIDGARTTEPKDILMIRWLDSLLDFAAYRTQNGFELRDWGSIDNARGIVTQLLTHRFDDKTVSNYLEDFDTLCQLIEQEVPKKPTT